MPIAFEPVLVVIQPIKYGEQNPARLAKLLTAAIPAAAETPPKSWSVTSRIKRMPSAHLRLQCKGKLKRALDLKRIKLQM